jgi:hypothetical protein
MKLYNGLKNKIRKPTTHSEVAHQWASREIESASCGSMSFKNGIIYSYDWWPMAKFCKTEEGKKQMIEEAKSEIDFDIKNKFEKSLKSHLSQLKIWIKNRVPFIIRQPLKLELI